MRRQRQVDTAFFVVTADATLLLGAGIFLLFFRMWALAGILTGAAAIGMVVLSRLVRHATPRSFDYEWLGRTFRWW